MLFDWFRRRTPEPMPDDLKDPELGRLCFTEVLLAGVGIDVWQGSRFSLDGKHLKVTIQGTREGPDPELRELVLCLRREYSTFRGMIVSAMTDSDLRLPDNAGLKPFEIHATRSAETGTPCLEILHYGGFPEDDGTPYAARIENGCISDVYRW